MSGKIAFQQDESPENSKKRQGKINKNSVSGITSSPGKITETIGDGDNAKNSFIWIAIRWSFLIGAITSLAIYLRPAYCQTDLQTNLIEDIKAAWGIFMPVITLALGYSFGKGR